MFRRADTVIHERPQRASIMERESVQILKYQVGMWEVEAKLEAVDDIKRIAVVCAVAGQGAGAIESRHTIVFDHVQGVDDAEETKAVTAKVLLKSH
jgi:hypothetical protein